MTVLNCRHRGFRRAVSCRNRGPAELSSREERSTSIVLAVSSLQRAGNARTTVPFARPVHPVFPVPFDHAGVCLMFLHLASNFCSVFSRILSSFLSLSRSLACLPDLPRLSEAFVCRVRLTGLTDRPLSARATATNQLRIRVCRTSPNAAELRRTRARPTIARERLPRETSDYPCRALTAEPLHRLPPNL